LKGIIIAIDGHSSCGKSTLSRGLANALDYVYIDSGAMYRMVTLYLQRQGIGPEQNELLREALQEIELSFGPGNRAVLNGEDVESEIRSMAVSRQVSHVAALPEVRRFLVVQQRSLAGHQGAVMDGRDIGSVVFPRAQLKIFLTADAGVRARRRYLELRERGMEADFDQVSENLRARNQIDSTRKDSPLIQASDAVRLDNTNMDAEETLAVALALARIRIRKNATEDR
jgi:cytidylate kinase